IEERDERRSAGRVEWASMLQAIESLIAELESADRLGHRSWRPSTSDNRSDRRQDPVRSAADDDSIAGRDVSFVHSFDTEHRDLARSGHVLELREREKCLLVVAAHTGSDDIPDPTGRAQAQVDGSWALQILSG